LAIIIFFTINTIIAIMDKSILIIFLGQIEIKRAIKLISLDIFN
jgi:hypothetical protein